MLRILGIVLNALLASTPSFARVEAFPPAFQERDIATNGTTLHVRVGGTGPAVVL